MVGIVVLEDILKPAMRERFERRCVEVEPVRARFGLDRWVAEMMNLYAA